MTSQITNHLLMVRPANFGFNPDTADNNAFQTNDPSHSRAFVRSRAVEEFDAFVEKLRASGVQVHVYQEKEGAVSTDSVFPNNWFSCHEDGLLVTYPMFSPLRRTERHEDIIRLLETHFLIKTHIKLEKWEHGNQFLEGTGSMILDRENRIVYACRSVRTDEELLDQFCYFMCYEKVIFDAVDKEGTPVYHTNVMMALGASFVVICLESVPNPADRTWLEKTFAETGKEVITISQEQMESFAGNMLQVVNHQDEPILVMSSQAYHSLLPEQVARLEKHNRLLHSDLSTIETYGGGSARCMMAEIFLPVK